MTKEQQRAVGLYAVLAYDWGDFIDMIRDEPDAVLTILHEMLTHPNEKHNKATKELNAAGATFVRCEQEKRQDGVTP